MKPDRSSPPNDWQTLRQVYDRRADEQYRRGPRVLARKHRGVIAQLNFAAGSRVLDAGCGDGVYCEYLSRQDYTIVIGCDLSPNIVITARGNVIDRGQIGRTHFSASNLACLPFADRSFDAIVCSQVIEHLPDDRSGFSELARLLRSGGTLIISTDNRNNRCSQLLALPTKISRAILRRAAWHYPFPHNNYRMAEFQAKIEAAGLRVIHAETFRFSLPPALQRVKVLARLLAWIEAWAIHLPMFRRWGDILLVKAVK